MDLYTIAYDRTNDILDTLLNEPAHDYHLLAQQVCVAYTLKVFRGFNIDTLTTKISQILDNYGIDTVALNLKDANDICVYLQNH
jgi:hypothetical protein